jgi:glycosyltransferase involved in cell wall biosynthesis
MTGLSVAVVTLNEEERLRACLESVEWADEIVVVDAESVDKTVQIARDFTDRIWIHPWPGFAPQKNFALAQVTQPWVLSLDADERVSPELRDAIRSILDRDGPADGYSVPRKNIFWGAWVRHGRLYPDDQLRLFRRGRGRFVEQSVHESVSVAGTVSRLSAPLIHESYRNLDDFVKRGNQYSTLAAQEAIRSGQSVKSYHLVLRPLGRFLSMYCLHRGFLDGWRGLLLAALYGYYVFLRTAKILEAREVLPHGLRS